MKTMVVFYSKTGTTKKVAEAIAAVLKCDIEEIIDTKSRSGPLGFLSAGKDAMQKKLTVIKDTLKNPASYELVIIGTPIWAGRMTPAVRTYISPNKGSLKKIAFFCVGEEPKKEKIFAEMEELCGKKPLALLGIMPKEIKAGEYTQKIKEFADALPK